MKRTSKIEINLNQSDPKALDLNKSSIACVPCLSEALKIDRKINARSLSQIKIEEIKKIVNSIFENKNKKN